MNVFFAAFVFFNFANLINRINTRYVDQTPILSQTLNTKIYEDFGYGKCKPDCNSKIYCQGELLHDVQMAQLFGEDSKPFVDKRLLYPENVILERYRLLKNLSKTGTLSREQLANFVDENFANDALDKWTAPDIRAEPSIYSRVRDKDFKKWILDLNQIWHNLTGRVNERVQQNPQMYSIIYVPNGFVKAGGRFEEMYYWDSYWIIRGLLLCDMWITAKGMIENMLWIVQIYGHMLNGNRRYYEQRSQPPLLIQMAASYHSYTKDDKFIRDNLEIFEKEFQFWYKNRMVTVMKNGKSYRLARYNAISCSPRPESYRADYVLSLNVTTTEEKNHLYTALKSGAESGWDFSSRHFRAKDGSNKGTLIDIDTQSFVFVDLNSILHANAVVLSEWYRYFKNEVKYIEYKRIANGFLDGINNVLWNENAGIWLDYDILTGKSRNYFFPSNLTPLWTGSYPKTSSTYSSYVERAVDYLLEQGIIKSDLRPVYYGVPTSKFDSSQQWDFPNVWSPLQAIVIQGLYKSHHPEAKYVAFRMAQNWIKTTYTGFVEDGCMYEKYSAVELGVTGGGGEYEPQVGFGWTNGFIFEIFNIWGNYLQLNKL